jgi:acetyl esterase/lipase
VGLFEPHGRHRRRHGQADLTDAACPPAAPAPETAGLRALLGTKPRPVGWDERRARIEEVAAVDGPPADVSFTPLDAGGVPAEWSRTLEADRTRAVLFLHGGGYCSGSIASHRTMAGGIAKAAGVGALAVAYRLAPEHPFPAALDDVLAAWRFLRGIGFDADRLAVAGDSAGAGLALALMLRLRDAGEPQPAAAWLVSPWVDLTMSGATIASKDAVDPLIHGPYLAELAAAYLAGDDPRDPLVSPLFADLAGLSPALIQVGSDETLLDDAVRLAGRLGAADVAVRLEVWPGMTHAFPLWAARLPSGRAALDGAGAFLRARLFRE